MADKDIAGLHLQKVYTGPDGNSASHVVELGPLAIPENDRYFVAPLPRGMQILAVKATIHGVAAGATMDVGMVQKGPGSFADDEDYFINGASTANPAYVDSRANTRHKPFHVKADNVVLSVKALGAAFAATFNATFEIDYTYEGNL